MTSPTPVVLGTTPEASFLARAAFFCTWASVLSILFSIAVSQTFLALAVAALLMSGMKLRMPPIWLPLVVFMAGTVMSLALSGAAWTGRPQIRKFFVYLTLLAVFSTLRTLTDARRLVLSWAAAGGLAGAVAFAQFAKIAHAAYVQRQPLYNFYVGRRITGFMGHWMTFGGEQMIVLVMVTAFLLFSPRARGRVLWLAAGAALLGGSLLLGLTRSVWLGAAVAVAYLLWFRKRWVVLAAPGVLAALLLFGPVFIRTRFDSGFQPSAMDSNEQRIVCWRTGWQMIRAHPWFGLGPEMVRWRFMQYVPADIRGPLDPDAYYHLHNIYIHYAAERGIPTMLVLVWMFLKILWDSLRAIRRLPAGPSDERFLLHGAVATTLAIMVSGIFELNLGDSEVLTLFLAAVALGYLACEKANAAAAR